MSNVFDEYSFKARLQPALIILVPLVFTVFSWVPSLYEQITTFLGGAAAAFGLTILISNIVRALGRKVEKQLFQEWGGPPTTIWLRHSDQNLDTNTKARYHRFFEANLDECTTIPTEEEEQSDPQTVDALYETAVRWLREKTRDLELVLKENISYGFRRNLYGSKSLGIAIAGGSMFGNGVLLIINFEGWYNLSVAGLTSFTFCAIMLAIWLTIINSEWVKDSADGYARAILSYCDM